MPEPRCLAAHPCFNPNTFKPNNGRLVRRVPCGRVCGGLFECNSVECSFYFPGLEGDTLFAVWPGQEHHPREGEGESFLTTPANIHFRAMEGYAQAPPQPIANLLSGGPTPPPSVILSRIL